MIKTTINGHDVEIYDNIETLPIRRFQKYNKMMMIDSGIGGDLSDVTKHIQRIQLYIKNGELESAQTELSNYHKNLLFIQSNLNPKYLACACLVLSIDGKIQGIEDDDLRAIVEKLNGAILKDFNEPFEVAKKKIDAELKEYFPSIFETSDTKEIYDLLRARTMAVLNGIIQDTDNGKEIDRLNEKIMLFSKPQQFEGKKNAEIEFDKNFEKLCLTLSAETKNNVKNYSVMEFYTALEFVKETQRKAEQALKRK